MAAEVLLQKGWRLTAEGLDQCKQNGNRNADAVVKAALNIDLRDIGDKFLPEDINRGKVDFVQGPCVLQIQKIRNISAPKDNEDSQSAPRLLKFTFTDGHQNCGAVEIESVDKISLNTPPGSKVQLLGTVQIEHGFLLLNNQNTRFFGGHVDKLVESWQLKRSLAKQSRSLVTTEGGPPPFVPFGQRINQDRSTNRKDNFKSLEQSKEKKEENGEFEQQRQATIAEALKGKQEKVFGGAAKPLIQGKDVSRIVEMGFSSEDATLALRQNQGDVNASINALLSRPSSGAGNPRGRGYQRAPPASQERADRSDRFEGRQGGRGKKFREGNKESEVEDVMPTRPSGPATLFDFLEKKMTIKDDGKPNTKDQSSKASSSSSTSSSRAESTGGHTSKSSYLSKSQSNTSSKSYEDRHQNQAFTQNRRQNLPPRFANKYNRDSDSSNSGRSSNQRPNSSYHNYNNNNSNSSRQNDFQDTSYGNQNSYGNYSSERTNYKRSDGVGYRGERNNDRGYSSRSNMDDRNNHRSNAQSYDGSERNSHNSSGRYNYGAATERSDYSSADKNASVRNRSENADTRHNSNSYRKTDYNPPTVSVYDAPSNPSYPVGQYNYPPPQGYRPNTVPYPNNYPGAQGDWGQQPESQSNMSTVYMHNNGDRVPREWRKGDNCLAPYSGDGQFYNAVIEAYSYELPTCSVMFTGYGNSEEVLKEYLRPLPKHGKNDRNWDSGGKNYSSQPPMKQQSPMGIPQGMAYAPVIDDSQFTANHISSMEFRRGGGGNSYQKRPERQGGNGRNQGY